MSAIRVKNGKNNVLLHNDFSQVTFELRKLVHNLHTTRRSTRRNVSKCMLTLKCHSHNLTSGQRHVRSRDDPSWLCCISVDASVREKHIGIIPSALALLSQKLEIKTSLTSSDLE